MCLFEIEFCLDICPGVGLLDHVATKNRVLFNCATTLQVYTKDFHGDYLFFTFYFEVI